MSESDGNYTLRALIAAGANIEARDKVGLTPLHHAVIFRNHGGVDILIEAGASINAKSSLKRTCLHFAISNDQFDKGKRTLPLEGTGPDELMVNMLLSKECMSIDKKDIRGESPLMWAVMERHTTIANALLLRGANPSTRNKDSVTPLHVALSAEDPCLAIVLLLLMNRASLNIADKDGNTPIDIMIQKVEMTLTYRFAYRCMEAIALSYNVDNRLKRKLESNGLLWLHLKDCANEVKRMKSDVITDTVTAFAFYMNGIDEFNFRNAVFQVYKPVVTRLLAGLYPNFGDFMLYRISKSDLCTIFETIVSVKEMPYSKECSKRNLPDLFSKMDVYILSKYLSKMDVFCLIVAFSEGRIAECMRDIRNCDI